MDKPAPLVDPSSDLGGFPRFYFNVDRLFQSVLLAICTNEELGCAFLLWCRAWMQTPPASLPNDEKILASFCRLSPARWKKLKATVLHGFIECSDGRLYHPVLAAEVAKSLKAKEQYQKDKARLYAHRDETRLAKRNGHSLNGSGSHDDV